MMDSERYDVEYQVLAKNLPPNMFQFYRDVGLPYASIVMGIRTDGEGNLYTVYVDLKSFPESVPEVYVRQQVHGKALDAPLLDCHGNEMDSPSHCMHTLEAHPTRRWTQICHFDSDEWDVGIPLILIYIRAKMWLEIYEQHLRTGNDINYYLKSKNRR